MERLLQSWAFISNSFQACYPITSIEQFPVQSEKFKDKVYVKMVSTVFRQLVQWKSPIYFFQVSFLQVLQAQQDFFLLISKIQQLYQQQILEGGKNFIIISLPQDISQLVESSLCEGKHADIFIMIMRVVFGLHNFFELVSEGVVSIYVCKVGAKLGVKPKYVVLIVDVELIEDYYLSGLYFWIAKRNVNHEVYLYRVQGITDGPRRLDFSSAGFLPHFDLFNHPYDAHLLLVSIVSYFIYSSELFLVDFEILVLLKYDIGVAVECYFQLVFLAFYLAAGKQIVFFYLQNLSGPLFPAVKIHAFDVIPSLIRKGEVDCEPFFAFHEVQMIYAAQYHPSGRTREKIPDQGIFNQLLWR